MLLWVPPTSEAPTGCSSDSSLTYSKPKLQRPTPLHFLIAITADFALDYKEGCKNNVNLIFWCSLRFLFVCFLWNSHENKTLYLIHTVSVTFISSGEAHATLDVKPPWGTANVTHIRNCYCSCHEWCQEWSNLLRMRWWVTDLTKFRYSDFLKMTLTLLFTNAFSKTMKFV